MALLWRLKVKLLVASDAHLFQTSDGKIWAKSIYGYSFWTRYLNIFDSVRIVARVKETNLMDEKKLIVSGPGIEVYSIPFFQGPKQLAQKYVSIQKRLNNVDEDCDVALLRMPSQTAFMTYKHLKRGIPIGGEIVYDLTEDAAKKDGNPIINLLNRIQSNNLAKFCLAANGVSYVTEKLIQDHYPSYARIHGESEEHFETFYSTITLASDAYTGPRIYNQVDTLTIALSSVAMNSERKGEKVLIKALRTCRSRGYDVKAIIIGDGSLRPMFEQYAKENGVSDHIKFTGLLPSSDEVRKIMLKADMFVFPTQGEGLPRGILEAMAIGLPVLSTPVGGIPEVINKKYLIDPMDDKAFADEICRLIDTPNELTEMSKKNYEKSLMFSNDILQDKRDDFYLKLKKLARRD